MDLFWDLYDLWHARVDIVSKKIDGLKYQWISLTLLITLYENTKSCCKLRKSIRIPTYCVQCGASVQLYTLCSGLIRTLRLSVIRIIYFFLGWQHSNPLFQLFGWFTWELWRLHVGLHTSALFYWATYPTLFFSLYFKTAAQQVAQAGHDISRCPRRL